MRPMERQYEIYEPKKSSTKSIILAIIVTGLLAAGGIFAYNQYFQDESNLKSEAVNQNSEISSQAESNNAVSTEESNTNLPDSQQLNSDEVGLQLTLQDYKFSAVGTVTSEETKAAIEQATLDTYGELGQANITVDPNLETTAWEEAAPSLVKGHAALLNGQITVTGNQTVVNGEVPAAMFEDAVLQVTSPELGYPELTNNIEVLQLNHPTIEIVGKGEKVELSGELPSQFLIDLVTQGATEVYGQGNVSADFNLNKNTYAPFRFARFGYSLSIVKPFQNYEAGTRNGQVYAVLPEGVTFDTNSAEVLPETQQKVAQLALYMKMSENPVTIVGHTDSDGSDSYNQALSEKRAEAVRQIVLNALGEENSDRITAVGKGESEPAADNSTEAGKAQNRRVEVLLDAKDG